MSGVPATTTLIEEARARFVRTRSHLTWLRGYLQTTMPDVVPKVEMALYALDEEGEAAEAERAKLKVEHRDVREILKAWGLGDADKMNVLMFGAFLREFGKAPEPRPLAGSSAGGRKETA